MNALDRTSPLPLWAQLSAELRRRIATGEFDERLPSEHELRSLYDVSRHTVREALRDLKDTGLLRSERGRGTSIERAPMEQSLRGIYSLARSVRTAGLTEKSEVLVHEVRPAGAVAKELGLDTKDPVLYVERVRLADDEPLALDRSWLPARTVKKLRTSDFESGSLYDALARRCGLVVAGGRETLRPAVPDAELRERLHMARGEAVFLIERLATTADGVKVERRTSAIRGDRYTFVSEW